MSNKWRFTFVTRCELKLIKELDFEAKSAFIMRIVAEVIIFYKVLSEVSGIAWKNTLKYGILSKRYFKNTIKILFELSNKKILSL